MKKKLAFWTALITLVTSITMTIHLVAEKYSIPMDNSSIVENNIRDTIIVIKEKPMYLAQQSIDKNIEGIQIDHISRLINDFDKSYIDFIHTRQRKQVVDTLDDGRINRRRVPKLESKSSEQTYKEMESAHSQLIAVLIQKNLRDNYSLVLDNQEQQLRHALKSFSNLSSELLGLEASL